MRKWLWMLFFPLAAQAAGEAPGRRAAWGDPQQPRCCHVI
jgi:hypothetical protein